MAKNYRKNMRRTMFSTLGRFLAVLSIVALGTGFLAGLISTSPDIEDSMEEYTDGQNLYDFRIVSTLGLTDEDVQAVQALEGVEALRPAYSADLLIQRQQEGADVLVARAHTLPVDAEASPEGKTAINGLLLQEGRWPQAPNECVVEGGGSALAGQLALDDTFECTADNVDLADKMAVTTFTVVGRVRDSYYFSYEREPASVGDGSVSTVFYVPRQAFSYTVYTELYGTVTGAQALPSLGEEYRQTVAAVTNRVKDIADARAQARYDSIVADAQAEIDDAWQEYNDAKTEADTELEDARQQLEDGRKKLTDGETELADAQTEYDDGVATLNENAQKLQDGQTALNLAIAQLNQGQAAYDEGMAQLQAAGPQLAAAKQQLEDGQRQYDEGMEQLLANEKLLEEAEKKLEDAQKQLEDGAAEIAANEEKLAAGKAAYEAGETQYAQLEALHQGDEAYRTGVQAIVDAQAQQGITITFEQAEQTFTDAALADFDAKLESLQGLQTLQQALDEAKAALDAVLANPAATAEEIAAAQTAYATADAMWQGAIAAAGFNDAQARAAVASLETLQAQRVALGQLHDAKAQIDAGVQAIRDAAEAQGNPLTEEQARAMFGTEGLAQTRAQLDEAKAQLETGETALAAAKKQLAEGQAQYDAGVKTLAENRTKWEEGKAQLEGAKIQLDAGWATYNQKAEEYQGGLNQMRSAKQTLDEGFATLNDKQNELLDAQTQIADARTTLADARQQIADGRATLAEKKQELLDGETDYATAKAEADAELADGKTKIEDAEAELNQLEPGEWYVWDRADNVSVTSFKGNVGKVEALANVFPVFFFLVAALVVSTTMTRMVEEERLQIGTMKALGYSNAGIMAKYLLYALTAAVGGAAVGLVIGFWAFPTVIWNAYTMMYYMPKFTAFWHTDYAILSAGSLIACALLATLSAGWGTMRETPAELMRPRAPKAGKRILLEYITPLWRHMAFTQKVTARNLLRYKKRFWMTVIGVAGCTALLIAGFGISDSVNAIVTKQYENVYVYDLMTTVRNPSDTESGQVHDALFANEGAITQSVATALEKVTQTMPNGTRGDIYLMIPQNVEDFGNFVLLHERLSGKETPLTDTGVIVTEKLAEQMGVKAGDMLTLQNADGTKGEFRVDGVCENYVYHYVYLSPKAYQNGFGTTPEWNAVLSLTTQDTQAARDALSAKLLGLDDVTSVTFTTDTIKTVLNMLGAIDAVVVLVVIFAAALAFVVLYNLTNINIAERVKEIATIKVLGFYDKEVNSYVMRENVILSILGMLLGLGLGTILHRYIVFMVEVDAVMFGRTVDFSSYVYAAVLTMAFSMMVDFIMGRKLKRVSMVESMKAPE